MGPVTMVRRAVNETTKQMNWRITHEQAIWRRSNNLTAPVPRNPLTSTSMGPTDNLLV